MSKEPAGLDIAIMGRQFRVACPEDQQKDLLKAVEYLDLKMRQIRDSGKVIGVERIAIMAALNIAHEYLSTRVEGAFDIGELKRRMADMRNIVEQAISAQDELF
ncbi:MAG TPA: cell division protein ZapA [Burkholderiales bacterium]|nr:cell division protein ZapA [Burkholderiales bacterium]